MEAIDLSQCPHDIPFDCRVCCAYRENSLVPQSFVASGWYFEWDNVSQAAKRGCIVCSVLCSAILAVITEPTRSMMAHVSNSEGFHLTASGKTRIHSLELYSHEKAPSAFPAVPLARDICISGASWDCFKLAKSWLHNCLSTHTTCTLTHKSRLPTRLIDVGSSTADPHLYIPKVGEQADYIALSHCWGIGKPPLRTTVSNLSVLCRGMPLSDLPRNFQDAVSVTRAFGVKYLWIDSLCVLQDGIDDWVSESAYMGHIYTNALFVLAAAAGDGCYSGFLDGKKREPGVAIIFGQGIKGEESSLSVRHLPRMTDTYGAHFRLTNRRSKLSTRGWAFQEQILARRILAYSDEEMSWECLEHSLCECQTIADMPKSINAKLLINDALKDRSAFYPTWTSFIQEYTLRELSFISDRLPAFAGIAARVHSSTTGRYLAGIWSNYLLHGLAWLAHGESQLYEYGGFHAKFDSRRQEKHYAPSWSWASITGPIAFWSVTAKHEPMWDIGIQGIRFETQGASQYGSPKEASLELTGRLTKVMIGTPKVKDGRLDSFRVFLPEMSFCNPGKKVEFYANPDIWNKDYYLFSEPHYLLSLFHYEDNNRPRHQDEFCTDAAGLALVLRRAGKENDCYERVACVLITKEEHAQCSEISKETKFTLI
ncbi:HET-domain-containing protein [Zopfia rhizophila CBS 207.26]|uniref:HET-domain-containing protein n=1 Tax=Zopfia rhizophila CBS 207.26 TaxID=1314779 RepID=A0A6A6E9N4_9PEZI|nr:HET-domain-containing protein [Zopfia rhizophila CBS 207.26]